MSNKEFFNKLVRDKIPELIASKGGKPEYEIMNDENYISKLREKLLEESNEVVTAKTKDDITEELADLLEVMQALASFNEINFADVEKTRKLKKEKRGGFDLKILLKSTEIVDRIQEKRGKKID